MIDPTDTDALRAEIARLRALLDRHGIDWQAASDEPRPADPAPGPQGTDLLSTDEKLALFAERFVDRTDVHALRWESRGGDRSGYSPACANEWQAGLCEKPRIRCSECSHAAYLPLTPDVLYRHLAGEIVVGVYPLSPEGTCRFLAIDFDKGDWQADVTAVSATAAECGLSSLVEISRSGNGAHLWVFFREAVAASRARVLGTALISRTCRDHRSLSLDSYDRLFPNQDSLPSGGFGNLIALPLQKGPRAQGRSVFVDRSFVPLADPWAALAAAEPLDAAGVEAAITRLGVGDDPLDLALRSSATERTPWRQGAKASGLTPGLAVPSHCTLVLADKIYVEKRDLPQVLLNALVRVAAFANPEYYRAQRLGFSVWDKPRIIGCAENFPDHIALPRGCLDAVNALLAEYGITPAVEDERESGRAIKATFRGKLFAEQQTAVSVLTETDCGILHAPTAFGKTVTAAALIAMRSVSTLVLVHRQALLDQWLAKLAAFLTLESGAPGRLGGNKRALSGNVDVAMIPSVVRQGEVDPVVAGYGQVIVDECHHIGASSFESVMNAVRARYVVGLTATLKRRDGHDPVVTMQCGPVRHHATRRADTRYPAEVVPLVLETPIACTPDTPIQGVFRALAESTPRTALLIRAITEAVQAERQVLVLTERTAHLEALAAALPATPEPVLLHGRLGKRGREAALQRLENLSDMAPRLIIATGRFIGEGFDHPALDTLVLAMPIAWRGTLQQYVGRLHREHPGKRTLRIIDGIDTGHPALLRMWDKRLRGYRAFGYHVAGLDAQASLFA